MNTGFGINLLMCLVLTTTFSSGSSEGAKKPLYLAGILELSDTPRWLDFGRMMPHLIEYTLKDINNMSDLLIDYDLQIIYRDMKYNAGYAAKQLLDVLSEDPPKVAIFGPSKSEFLASTGQIVPFCKIIQVGYLDTLPVMQNFKLYPTTFTVLPDVSELKHVLIETLHYFDWNRVGTITQVNAHFQDQMMAFHGHMEVNDITLATAAIMTDEEDAKSVIVRLKQFDVRIIMVVAKNDHLRALFCQVLYFIDRYLVADVKVNHSPSGNQAGKSKLYHMVRLSNTVLLMAYHMDVYGPGYVWIVVGATLYGSDLIGGASQDKSMKCTVDELIRASWGYFQINFYKISRENRLTIGGKFPTQVVDDILRMGEDMQTKAQDLGVAVDALWSLAIGLNHSVKYLDEMGLKLHEYNYTDMYLDAVLKGMHEASFNGVSGHVSFDSNGKRNGISYLQLFKNETIKDLAFFDPRDRILTWLVDPNTIWTGGRAPKDSFTKISRSVTPSTDGFAIVVTLDICGLVLTVGFLFFNVYYRNNRQVKLSSPMLNNVILVGCLLMYMEVFIGAVDYIYIVEEGTTHLCMVQAWMLALGFTILFGGLFSKTYRVYVIFRNYKLKKKHVTDVLLLALIGILIVVDVVILFPWSIVHPMEKVKMVIKTQTLVERNIILSEIYHYCHNESQAYWIAAVYVYKGLLLAFGAFLAWETRHVTIPALNDSKYIGACIYNVVVVCIFGVPLAHVLPKEQATLLFVLQSCLIIFCTTVCQCIIFIPKLHLKNQVQSRFLTSQMSAYTRTSTNMTVNVGSKLTRDNAVNEGNVAVIGSAEDSNDIDEVKEENRRLRMQMAEESIAIAKLRRSLQQMTGNIHFYRSGSQYVLFKTDVSSSCSSQGINPIPISCKELPP